MARSMKALCLSLGAALSLSACGLFSNESRYEPVELTQYAQSATGAIAWSTNIGSGSGYGFAPQVTTDSIFAATPDGSVARVNSSTGATMWRVKLEQALAGGVGVGDGVVAVTTRNGQVIALDAQNGNQVWSSRTSTIATTPPAVGNGVVVVRADDYRVQAYNVSDGTLLWSYVRTNPELALKTTSRMVMLPGAVAVAVPSGRLVGLNITNGRPVWEMIAASVRGPTDLDSVTDVVGMPVLTGNDACMASYQGNVLCYSVAQGGPQLRWAQPFSSSVGIDLTESALLGAAVDGNVSAFNRANGEVLWSNQTLKNRGLTNPVVHNNYVVVADYEGYAHFFNFANGDLQGRVSLGNSDPVVSPLVAAPNGVVAQTGNGNLVLFGVQ